MKNNFVAKHAQTSGAGFHTEKSKPDLIDDTITVKCLTCCKYVDINHNEMRCPLCGSSNIIEIGGLQ